MNSYIEQLNALHKDTKEWTNREKLFELLNGDLSLTESTSDHYYQQILRIALELTNDCDKTKKSVDFNVETVLKSLLDVYMFYFTQNHPANAQKAESCLIKLAENFIQKSLPFEYLGIVFESFLGKKYWEHPRLALSVLHLLFPGAEGNMLVLDAMMDSLDGSSHILAALDVFIVLIREFSCTKLLSLRLLVLKVCRVVCVVKDVDCLDKLKNSILALSERLTEEEKGVSSQVWFMSILALQSARQALGPDRSAIAALLYSMSCNIKSVLEESKEGGELFLDMLNAMNDGDPDVAFWVYTAMANLISLRPKNSVLNKMVHIMDEGIDFVLNENFYNILETVLASYIRHSIYPETLRAIFVVNSLIIIEIKSPLNAKIAVNFIINLQKACLVYVKSGRRRKAYLLSRVGMLLKLVADVYQIAELGKMATELVDSKNENPHSNHHDFDNDHALLDPQRARTIIHAWYHIHRP